MRFAYGVVHVGKSRFLKDTLDHIADGSRVLLINNQETGWSLARAWNHIADVILWNESYDAVIIMNDDVILRPDSGELLAWGLVEGQFEEQSRRLRHETTKYDDYWHVPASEFKEILLLSARHASPLDACTDTPDWDLLNNAKPIWQPGPDFSCFCVNRRLGQEIGRFDELFYPAYYEDNDTHRRIQLAGFEAGALAPYWHFRNGTIRGNVERAAVVSANFEKCKRRYCSKWGAPYDLEKPMGRETFLTPFNQ